MREREREKRDNKLKNITVDNENALKCYCAMKGKN